MAKKDRFQIGDVFEVYFCGGDKSIAIIVKTDAGFGVGCTAVIVNGWDIGNRVTCAIDKTSDFTPTDINILMGDCKWTYLGKAKDVLCVDNKKITRIISDTELRKIAKDYATDNTCVKEMGGALAIDDDFVSALCDGCSCDLCERIFHFAEDLNCRDILDEHEDTIKKFAKMLMEERAKIKASK